MLPKLEPMVLEHVEREIVLESPVKDHEQYTRE